MKPFRQLKLSHKRPDKPSQRGIYKNGDLTPGGVAFYATGVAVALLTVTGSQLDVEYQQVEVVNGERSGAIKIQL